MALGGLPPWLNVQPSDFVHAAQAGATLGHAIADSTLRAWEEQARMRMAAEEATARREQQAQQHAIETAMARLAADRLEQYRQSEIANRKAELGIQQQGLGLRERGIGVQESREAEAERRGDEYARHNMAMEEARQAAIKKSLEPKDYGEVQYLDVPGFPGVKAALRRGSPGFKIISPKRNMDELTAGQALSTAKAIPYLDATMRMGTNSPLSKYVQPLMDKALGSLKTTTDGGTNTPFKIIRIYKRGEMPAPVPSQDVNVQDVGSMDEEE